LSFVADGITAVTGDVSPLKTESESLDSQLNTLDGEGTDGAANLGEAVGDAELQAGDIVGGANAQKGGSTAPATGPGPKAPGPKRQLNGIGMSTPHSTSIDKRWCGDVADGLTAPLENYGATQELGSNVDSYLNTIDGQGTDDAAEAGDIVGAEELQLGDVIGGKNAQNSGTGGEAGAAPAGPGKPAGPKWGKILGEEKYRLFIITRYVSDSWRYDFIGLL
jgi:hypothetical protein